MPWTPMHTLVMVLLLALAVAVLTIVYVLDNAGYPSRRQRRAWRREHLELPHWQTNRRRQ